MKDFVHLHVHTQYSLLDGMCRTDEAAKLAHHLGMPALAITDHGNMHGVVQFYQAALEHGVKPIIGSEMYCAPGSMLDRKSDGPKESSYHCTLLAADGQGWANLLQLSTQSFLEGFYYRQRIDKERLAKHSAGIVCLSGCLKGEINQLLLKDDMEGALAAAGWYREVFGPDRFFLEVMENGIPEQRKVNALLAEIGRKTGIKLVATNDCHYLRRDDAPAHEVLLCIQTGSHLDDPKRLRLSTDQFYFKTPEEMAAAFAELPEALRSTVEIAERCNLTLDFGTYHLPRFHPPDGRTPADYLADLVREGLVRKMGVPPGTELAESSGNEAVRRAAYELGVIVKMGFASYFLIIHDFVSEARRRGIMVGPGRGSAAGSLVAYVIGITDINPLPYSLIFERFLNPERVSMPDIDVDFCDRRRDEVIKYLREKYGETNVAQIATFGTMAARAVVRDVGRALQMTFTEVDRIAKLISPDLGVSLKEEVVHNPEIVKLIEADERMKTLFNVSLRLEGLARHSSTHAAGMVITERPIYEYAPLFKGSRGDVATQFDMESIAKIGLLKVDILGLKTLSVIEDAVALVRQRKNVEIADYPLDDPKTYRLLAAGETLGVFQLESRGMQDLCRRSRPREFEDLVAILALYRPGPMKSGMVDSYVAWKKEPSKIEYIHPGLEPILRSTYGVILYQEQVMQIAHDLGGFTMGEADQLRKGMGKKVPEEIAKMQGKFVAGAVANGMPAKTAERIFEQIINFGGYGFNKSHSAGYAVVSYQTAWLKANHPLEFMTALLNSEIGASEKIAEYAEECERMNIWVLPPDVTESGEVFSPMGNDILFGLAAVKNVGSGAIRSIVEARESGPFPSLHQFCERVDQRLVNRKVLDSLVKAGAFDFLETPRSQLCAILDEAIEHGSKVQKEKEGGQLAIFGEKDGPIMPVVSQEAIRNLPEWSEAKLLSYEKEMLGIYMSGHPLEKALTLVKLYATGTTGTLEHVREGGTVWLGGIVVSVRRTTTRKGEAMGIIVLEDLDGKVEIVFYPKVYEGLSALLRPNTVLFVKGRVEQRTDQTKVVAEDAATMNTIAERMTRSIEVDLVLPAPAERLEAVREAFGGSKGACPVFINIIAGGDARVRIKAARLSVNPSLELIDRLRSIVGDNYVRLG